MDHVVYVDYKAQEMESLLKGTKSMVLRGAMGRKIPYGVVNPGDYLYFINNNGEGLVKGKGRVEHVINSEKLLPEQCRALINQHQTELQLTEDQLKRWGDKRYLVLIRVVHVEPLDPFLIDKSSFVTMDDWLLVERIAKTLSTVMPPS